MEAGAAVGRETRFHDLPAAVWAPHMPFDWRRFRPFLPTHVQSRPRLQADTSRMALSAENDVRNRCNRCKMQQTS